MSAPLVIDEGTSMNATHSVGKDFATIGAALAVAEAGDTVLVQPGIYEEELTVPDGVTLAGVPGRECTIRCKCLHVGKHGGVSNVILDLN